MVRLLFVLALVPALLIGSLTGPVAAQDGPLPETRMLLSMNRDFAGTDLSQIFDTTFEACRTACEATDGCTAFTFNSRNRSCFPKSDVTGEVAYDGAMSARLIATSRVARDRAAERAADLDGLGDAALREAHEEVGLPRQMVELVGTMASHETVTGFLATPVVGLVRDAFVPVAEPGEVAEVFRVPFDHVTDPARYSIQWRRWRGQRRYYYTAPFGPYYIWGATARMLRVRAGRISS